MQHKMRLVDFAFKAIKNGEKDIEVRLNDEKRRLINVNDTILFEHIDTKETIEAKVVALHHFKTFKELFDKFNYKRIGVKETDNYTIMNDFYTKEEQDKYGALGIEIKLL